MWWKDDCCLKQRPHGKDKQILTQTVFNYSVLFLKTTAYDPYLTPSVSFSQSLPQNVM